MAVRLIFVPATPAVPQIKEEPAKKMMGKDVILKNYKRAADYKNAVKVAGKVPRLTRQEEIEKMRLFMEQKQVTKCPTVYLVPVEGA